MLDKYSLIIFDWDGTVVDSVPNIVKALRRAAENLALPLLNESDYRGVIGMSLEEAFRHLYPDAQADLIRHLISVYRTHHHQLELNASEPFDGVADGLERIKASGTSIAVATGKRQAGLSRSMTANGYDDFFHFCCTADDAASKPDPEMLNLVLEALSVPAEKALMVGDSVHDMAMAANAGIDRVAVTYGAQPAERLKQHQPVLIVDHFSEFVDWLGLGQARVNEC